MPINVYGVLRGTITASGTLQGTLAAGETLEGGLSLPVGSVTPIYTGSYDFTPTQATQTIEIANKKATANITIEPIPSNYGLITYNGSVLTVS